MVDIQIHLGQKVRAFRKELAWSQEQLAEATGLHRTYISQLERGLRNPTLTVLGRIAKALNVELISLLEK